MFYGEKKKCVGSYSVKGYNRDDGTKVSGYTRTCGAKHAGRGSMTGAAANVDNNGKNKYSLNAVSKEIKTDTDILFNALNSFLYKGSLAHKQEMFTKMQNLPFNFAEYYKLSLDYANQKQLNKNNAYLKFKDIDNNLIKSFIKKKFDIPSLNDYTDVVIPQSNSPLVKSVLNSPELKNELKLHMDDIKKGKFINDSFTITFNTTKDVQLTLGHATMYNLRVVNSHICGTLIDYYDFKKEDYKYSVYDLINNNAHLQQRLGKLNNYLIIFPIRVPVKSFK